MGSELETSSYGCEDHFLEFDTFLHSWQIMGEILKNPDCRDILIFIGMPIMHENSAYNCLVAILNG